MYRYFDILSYILIHLLHILCIDAQTINTSKDIIQLCPTVNYKLSLGLFGKEKHWLCLKLNSFGPSLTKDTSVLLLDPDMATESSNATSLSDYTRAYGFPIEEPSSGSAEGYIGEDDHFYGVLHLANRTLYADPHGLDKDDKNFGPFENDHMAGPIRPKRHNSQVNPSIGTDRFLNFPFNIERPKRNLGIARSRICDLMLLADKDFFEKDCKSSLSHTVRRLLHAVSQADVIFRNADFNEDGVPDNIGFSVKYILVLTSNETNTRVFGDMLGETVVDGRDYLMRFARLRRLSEVCLGVAFSGFAFRNRTLGLSFTSLGGGLGGAAGGLCDRRAYGRSFNTLAIAHATADSNSRVPERIAALTLAHEIGHSFGAHHDDNFPNPECQGYLMGSQSSTANNVKHYEFSMCSKRLIAATLSSMSYCLQEEDISYCGNGIVEKGEACDCGLPSMCSKMDPCCTPRAGGAAYSDERAMHRLGCAVAPSAVCHPSQGSCCNSKCQFVNLNESGITCETQNKLCNCENMTSDCRCGLGGRCMPDGSCHAAECARLDLKECRCRNSGIGGALEEAERCGVCCKVEEGDCVSAEDAARLSFDQFHLPHDWPDEDYRGPNITVDLCRSSQPCNVTLRAWPVGSPCIAQNAVGVCSPRGVCKSSLRMPRSNVYPDARTARLQLRHLASKDRSVTPLSALFLTTVLVQTYQFV